MNAFPWPVLLIPAFGLLMYLLYRSGCISVQRKRALAFIGSNYKARFTSCTGNIRRILRFRENAQLRFLLEQKLTAGELWAELLDDSGRCILRLDENAPAAELALEGRTCYKLIVHFRSASGRYELSWF